MNIIDVLTELGIDYREHGNSPHVTAGWIGVICCFCGRGTSNYGMGIPLESPNFASCWSCGVRNLAESLSEASGRPLGDVRRLLKGIARIDRPERLQGKLTLPEGIGPLLPPHRKYLRSRGFDPDQLEKLWKIQATGLTKRLPWRIFIPVQRHGKTASWTTRSLSNQGVRYISAKPEEEAIPHKDMLYGEDYARSAVIICEGPTDVWRIGPGAVAMFGLGFTTDPLRDCQISRLTRYPIRAICFDNEMRAQDRAVVLQRQLQSFPGKTYRIELDADDPGSASDHEIRLLRKTFLAD